MKDQQNTAITAEEFASQQQLDNGAARNGIDIFFENYDIDVVVSELGQAYAPAGYPALTVPAGYAEDGTPQGTVFIGPPALRTAAAGRGLCLRTGVPGARRPGSGGDDGLASGHLWNDRRGSSAG